MSREQKVVDGAVEGVDHIELKRSQSSVEIKDNGKVKSYTIKTYHDDPKIAMELAFDLSVVLDAKLDGKDV